MDEQKFEKITKYIKSGLVLLTGIASVISVILVQLFKGGAYLQEKGYYDFWNIPSIYIEVNSANKLFQLLLMLSLMLIASGIALIYCYYFFELCYLECNKTKKVTRFLSILLAIPIFVDFLFIC